jgi:hypothetical protein
MLVFLMETESEAFVTVKFVRIRSGLTNNLPNCPYPGKQSSKLILLTLTFEGGAKKSKPLKSKNRGGNHGHA